MMQGNYIFLGVGGAVKWKLTQVIFEGKQALTETVENMVTPRAHTSLLSILDTRGMPEAVGALWLGGKRKAIQQASNREMH